MIIYVNRRAVSLSGYRRSELIGGKVELLVPSRLRALHAKDRQRFHAGGHVRLIGAPDTDFSLRRRDGTAVAAELALGPGRDDTGAVSGDVRRLRPMEAGRRDA